MTPTYIYDSEHGGTSFPALSSTLPPLHLFVICGTTLATEIKIKNFPSFSFSNIQDKKHIKEHTSSNLISILVIFCNPLLTEEGQCWDTIISSIPQNNCESCYHHPSNE